MQTAQAAWQEARQGARGQAGFLADDKARGLAGYMVDCRPAGLRSAGALPPKADPQRQIPKDSLVHWGQCPGDIALRDSALALAGKPKAREPEQASSLRIPATACAGSQADSGAPAAPRALRKLASAGRARLPGTLVRREARNEHRMSDGQQKRPAEWPIVLRADLSGHGRSDRHTRQAPPSPRLRQACGTPGRQKAAGAWLVEIWKVS